MFTDAKIDAIKELQPDLVIGFSDIQAQIAHDLIREGMNVWCTNQRSLDEIQETLLQFAAIVNRRNEGLEHLTTWNRKLETWRERVKGLDGLGSISRNGLTP